MEKLSNGQMTYVEYINQHDESFVNEYKDFCRQHSLNPKSDDSALAFLEMKDDELDDSMDN